MTGCHTCAGFGDRHDPVAHGWACGTCNGSGIAPDHSPQPDDEQPCPECAWDEADYRRDGDQALTALAASIRDSREGGQEGTG